MKTDESGRCPDPGRSAVARANRAKRRGLTAEGRQRLREAALANRPWEHATGPRTPQGKARAARNGKLRQKGALSTRELRAVVAGAVRLARDLAASRRLLLPPPDQP
jgi:hypothetical protein